MRWIGQERGRERERREKRLTVASLHFRHFTTNVSLFSVMSIW